MLLAEKDDEQRSGMQSAARSASYDFANPLSLLSHLSADPSPVAIQGTASKGLAGPGAAVRRYRM